MRLGTGAGQGLVLLAALAAACADSSAPAERTTVAVPVELAIVAAEDVPVVVRAIGTLEATRAVELRAERSGRVVELHAGEGGASSATPVLARRDDAEPRAALALAEAALAESAARSASAANTHRRTSALQRQGVASSESLDEARLALDAARAGEESSRARLAMARLEVEHSVVLAPFDGVLGRWRIDDGAFVQRGEVLGRIVADDPLELVFTVPDRWSSRVHPGADVRGDVTGEHDAPFTGKVRLVEPTVDPESRTVKVEARVPNSGRRLRPGQLATVRLVLETHGGAAVVPEEAIVAVGEDRFVFAVEKGQARAIEVALGVRLPGRVEVTGAIRPGATIVRTGHQQLSPAAPMPVREVRLADDRPAG